MSEQFTGGEAQATPGPWEWVERTGYHDLVGANGVVVISDGSACGEYGPDIDVKGPDGCLLEAAPDLLQACETFLQTPSHEQLHWDLMKAAVARARRCEVVTETEYRRRLNDAAKRGNTICWKCDRERKDSDEKCEHCGADSTPF